MSTRTLSGTAPVETDSRVLVPLVLIVLFGFFSIGVPFAAFPAHIRGTLGFSSIWVGVALGLQSMVTLATRHYAGLVADRKGAKTAVSRGISLTVASGVVSMVSLAFTGSASFSVLLLSRVVLGFGESLLITGALAWGVGLLGPARVGRVMAWSGMAMYGAVAASAPVSLYLGSHLSFSAVVAAAILSPCLAALVTWMLPATPAMGQERIPFYKVMHQVWRYGAGLFFSAVGFAGLAGFSVLYFQQRGWENASLVMPVFGMAYILARLFFANAPDQYGGRKVALVCLTTEILGLALVWQAPSPMFALLGAALTGFGYSLTFPSFGVEAVKGVEPQFKGVTLGAYVAFFDLALGVTGPLAGLVANEFGYSAVFLFGLVSSGVSLVIAWRMKA